LGLSRNLPSAILVALGCSFVPNLTRLGHISMARPAGSIESRCETHDLVKTKEMKTKYLLIALGTLLAAGALWAARTAWRVHCQVVTLNVRNAPLAEVLHKIEKQTWKRIRAEKALDARITLRVADKPLSYVLNRVGEQAGARWSTVNAVYGSSRALKALDAALRGDGKLETAGWTKIAPNAADFEAGGKGEPAEHLRVNPKPDDSDSVDSSPPPGAFYQGAERSLGNLPPIPPREGAEPGPGQERRVLAKRTKDGPVMFFGGPSGKMEMWSAEELVLESALGARLGGDTNQAPTAQAAAEAACKVKGRWRSFVAFRKSSMGIGFGGTAAPGRPGLEHGPGEQNERFANLTPEQRVKRARERLQWKKIEQPFP
jgi:hypothetical protein